MKLIELKNLDIFYSKPVLIDITLEVKHPSKYGLLGENGSGKTTFLKTLVKLHKGYKGSVKIMNLDIEYSGIKPFSVGYTPELIAFHKDITAKYFLIRYSKLYGNIISLESKINTAIKKVGLLNYADQKISTFSKGMKKRLLIAYSILVDPDVLIMDEPFEGLDPSHKINLREIINQRFENGKSTIVSSHEIQTIEKCCNKVGIIRNRNIKTIDINSSTDLESIYNLYSL
ncbi:MAG: ABC transporter ATP-binding protein [Balneolales bacterium]|nr:ABC transporter ATP-binding protein [Balneolales bacterium]